MQKFEFLRQPLLWFWIAVVTRTRKKKKIPKIVATFVYASSQGQRTHSARTNSGHLRLCQKPRAAHALRSDQLQIKFQCSMGLTCFVFQQYLSIPPISSSLARMKVESISMSLSTNSAKGLISETVLCQFGHQVLWDLYFVWLHDFDVFTFEAFPEEL